MGDYKLSASLRGHEDDVSGVLHKDFFRVLVRACTSLC